MKKDIIGTEDFEPPSSVMGLGEWQMDRVVDPLPREMGHKKSPKIIPIRRVPSVPKFECSPHSSVFSSRFFPQATPEDWNDWRWQLRNRIRDIHTLSRFILLSEDEREAMTSAGRQLPVAITPYYASLLERDNPAQPIRRTVVPLKNERSISYGETRDPLGEEHDSPVAGLIHRYPDRALFLVTDFCSTYCRYCTRSRRVGHGNGQPIDMRQWERGIDYIKKTPAIRDVLISGGDPMTLSDGNLEWLLSKLRKIRHVDFLRIGTKVPVVLPQRITPSLCRMLKKYHPLWVSIHFTHPEEITPEVTQACERLADAGIPLGSQTVLLSGINDCVETMKRLVHGLLKIRVKPYYLYQCDPISGSDHFRTPVEKGLEIIRGLRGHTTGYAVPSYVIDAPGGGGKIPLLPDYFVGREGDDLLLKNYQGRIFRYPDPLDKEVPGNRSSDAGKMCAKEGMDYEDRAHL
ncbi:MAG: KamA family radical SAM protein [Pseudomonadota bacterium]